MQTFSSRELQTRFGAVLDVAKREPVTVTQYGRPSVMIVPFEIGQEAVRVHSASRFADFYLKQQMVCWRCWGITINGPILRSLRRH